MENWKEEVAKMIGLEMIEESKFKKAAAGALLGLSMAGAGVGAYKAGAYNQREMDRDTVRQEKNYSGEELKKYKYETSGNLYGSELENMSPKEVSEAFAKYFGRHRSFSHGGYIEKITPMANGLIKIKLVNYPTPYIVGVMEGSNGNKYAIATKCEDGTDAKKVKTIQLKYTSEFKLVADELYDAIDTEILKNNREESKQVMKNAKKHQREIAKELSSKQIDKVTRGAKKFLEEK